VGRKRFGKRQYFFLCIAGLIFFSLVSCVPIRERPIVPRKEKPVPCEKEGCLHLEVWESLARHEDFETLLKQTQEALANLPKNKPADELLFTLGLLYAHPENSKKNYKKSLAFFKRVVNEYPRSVCVGEAKIWAGVLEDIEKAAKVDLEIEQKKKELGK
jgi:tetratricopeptide (TPR) repeat protein